MIKMLIVPPGAEPNVAEVTNELKTLQSIVDGYIETLSLEDNVILVCNEEGRIQKLPSNRTVVCSNRQERIVGTFFLVGFDGEGDFTSLPDAVINKYQKLFSLEGR